MGRLIAGMLVAIVAAFVFTAPAGAAEIPPTKECSRTFAKLLGKYMVQSEGSQAKAKKANRKFANGLAKAGCISDAEPVIDWVKPSPFSEQCVEASKAANEFWKPVTRRFENLAKRQRARERKLNARSRQLTKRIRKLRQAGASEQRIRPLVRRQIQLMVRSLVSGMKLISDQFDAVTPQASATTLTMFELISLRCIGGKTFQSAFTGSGKFKEPAARVIHRHHLMVSFSVLAAMSEDVEGLGFASASSLSEKDLKGLPSSRSCERPSLDALLPTLLCEASAPQS